MTGRVSRYFAFGPYRLDPEQRLLVRGDEYFAVELVAREGAAGPSEEEVVRKAL